MRQTCFITVAILAYFVNALAQAQEVLKGTAKTGYSQVRVAPDNKRILAIPSSKGAIAARDEYGLHVFDRSKHTKNVVYEDDRYFPHSIAISPSGKELLAGGYCFFGGWKAKSLKYWFEYKGCPEPLDQRFIAALTAPKRADKIAYSENRSRVLADAQELTQCKLMVWDINLGTKEEVQILSKNKLDLLVSFQIAYADSGKLLAHWNPETKEVVVHDVSKLPFKEIAAFDLKLSSAMMAFSPDERSLWVRVDRKLQQFDLATKKKLRSINVGEYLAWFHVLSDNPQLMIFEENEKGAPTVRFVDPDGKNEKRVRLEKNGAFPSISPDESLLAACGFEGGIYLWSVSELRKKAK